MGLKRIAARAVPGAISFKSSSHYPVIVASLLMKPVRLPPGRAKLSTKPEPIGSWTSAYEYDVGMVRVCC